MMTRKFNQLLVSLGVTITLLANAYPQAARTVMVQSNSGVLLFPTNLWSANASSARSGLSLATHATNPIVPVTSGGSGATNAATARTNFGLVWSGLTNSNAADFRSALSLSLAALTNTNNATFLTAIGFGTTNAPSLAGLTLTNGTNNLVLSASASESRTNLALGWVGLTNTNASGFRSALELSASWLTNTNVTNFRTAIGLGAANDVVFNIARVNTLTAETGQVLVAQSPSGLATLQFDDNTLDIDAATFQVGAAIEFKTTTNAATTRTNLGLPLAALTNTSNVTMMRALAGSTDTNQPFSGTFVFVDDSSNAWSATVSNGIILSVIEQ